MSDEIDTALEDVLIDAHGEDEQLWAFRPFFEDEAELPFLAEVVGSPVEVIGVDYDGDERRALTAKCRRNDRKYSVSLLDIVAGPVPTPTAVLLTAHRRWSGADALPDRR